MGTREYRLAPVEWCRSRNQPRARSRRSSDRCQPLFRGCPGGLPFNRGPGAGEVAEVEVRAALAQLPNELAHPDASGWLRNPLEQPVGVDIEAAQLDLVHAMPLDKADQGIQFRGRIADPGKRQQVDGDLSPRRSHDAG